MVSLQKLRDKVCVLCKAKDYIRSWMIASIAERILAAIPGASQVTLRDARYTSSQDFSAKGFDGSELLYTSCLRACSGSLELVQDPIKSPLGTDPDPCCSVVENWQGVLIDFKLKTRKNVLPDVTSQMRIIQMGYLQSADNTSTDYLLRCPVLFSKSCRVSFYLSRYLFSCY